jgi:hypothetical protein
VGNWVPNPSLFDSGTTPHTPPGPKKPCRCESRRVARSELWLCVIAKVKEAVQRSEAWWQEAGSSGRPCHEVLNAGHNAWKTGAGVGGRGRGGGGEPFGTRMHTQVLLPEPSVGGPLLDMPWNS